MYICISIYTVTHTHRHAMALVTFAKSNISCEHIVHIIAYTRAARTPLLTAHTHLQRESHEQNKHITHHAREKKK